MPMTATIGNPTVIRPEDVYPLQGLIAASGLSYSRIRNAAKAGLEMKTTKVGKRVFVKGSDAILFIEQLAAQSAAEHGGEA